MPRYRVVAVINGVRDEKQAQDIREARELLAEATKADAPAAGDTITIVNDDERSEDGKGSLVIVVWGHGPGGWVRLRGI